jgi:hypothetical protein
MEKSKADRSRNLTIGIQLVKGQSLDSFAPLALLPSQEVYRGFFLFLFFKLVTPAFFF